MALGETSILQTRSIDTGAIAQSTDDSSLIEGLPETFRILGVNALTDDSSRLTSVCVFLEDIAAATATAGDSHMLWSWFANDPAETAPTGFTVAGVAAATLGEYLEPAVHNEHTISYPFIVTDGGAQRRGARRIRVQVLTTAFGAGTVRVAVNVVMNFNLGFGGRVFEVVPGR